MNITLKLLEKMRACHSQKVLFTEIFPLDEYPEGVQISLDNVEKAINGGLDMFWFIEHIDIMLDLYNSDTCRVINEFRNSLDIITSFRCCIVVDERQVDLIKNEYNIQYANICYNAIAQILELNDLNKPIDINDVLRENFDYLPELDIWGYYLLSGQHIVVKNDYTVWIQDNDKQICLYDCKTKNDFKKLLKILGVW